MKRPLKWVCVGLALAGVGLAVLAWRLTGPSQMTIHGYIALGLALVLGGLLAGGLMALAFYSANKGYDDLDREG